MKKMKKNYKPFIDYSRFRIEINKKDIKNFFRYDYGDYSVDFLYQAVLFLDGEIEGYSDALVEEDSVLFSLMENAESTFGDIFTRECLDYIEIKKNYEETKDASISQ
jgi:hypothetical protein